MGRKKKPAEPKIGHNGGPLTEDRKRQLRGYVSEVERLNERKAEIAAQSKDIFDSAKDAGFDCKAIRHIIKERKKSKDEREHFEGICDVYKHALGMLADTPLGQAVMHRDLGVKPAGAQVDIEEAIAKKNGALSPEPHADVSNPPFAAPDMPATPEMPETPAMP
jgi:uncharacterized protein (UPF0335 family)